MGRWCVVAVALISLACGGAFEDQQHALDASDHAVLVEIDDLRSDFPSVSFDPGAQTWSKIESMGSWELEYSYETEAFTVTSLVFLNDTVDEADWVLWGIGLSTSVLASEGVEFVADPALLSMGDSQNCGLLMVEGVTGGNLCMVRDGTTVIAFVLVGGYFDEPGDLDRVLGPAITASRTYVPQASPLP